ncbi:hypothetical protein B0H19DRAFT_1199420, partial [Mycena capillaripes]
MLSFISLATASILLSGFNVSQAGASITPDMSPRACGTAGSLLCTSGSCCSGLFCSAQTASRTTGIYSIVCLPCRTSGAICDDTNVPCCSTGGTNGGPLYCASTAICRSCITFGAFCDAKICKGCLTAGSFCDPLVPCCSGTCRATG